MGVNASEVSGCRFDALERRVDALDADIDRRLEKLEDRLLEITKWQYKAIGFLAAFAFFREVLPMLLKATQ